MNYRRSLFLLGAIVSLASCRTTSNLRTLQVEMMKPAQFTLPEDAENIAIFKRDLLLSDTTTFKYHNIYKHLNITDSLIHYRELSNRCVAALANSLTLSGKFLKVVNYSDTLNYVLSDMDSSFPYAELHHKTGANVCIFLDCFYLKDYLINRNAINLGQEIFARVPEFRGSSELETIEPNLIWNISFYGNPSIYVFKQPEKLYYGNNLYPTLFGSEKNHQLLLQSVAEYLGNTFASKLIPSLQQVERAYYRSNNVQMLNGEKYLLEGDWLKAAEIYKKESKNKNQNIAAKATYNMALICEMEGNFDAATDWLDRSFSAYKNENQEHVFNCTQYSAILEKRKKEIELVEKQTRHP